MSKSRAIFRSTVAVVLVALTSSLAGFAPATASVPDVAAPAVKQAVTVPKRATTAANELAAAALAPALDCSTLYALKGAADPRTLYSLNPASGALTSVDTFAVNSNGDALNALGISPDGNLAYGVQANGTARTVYRLSRPAGTTSSLGAGVNSAAITHGAVNPANGFFYYGGISSGIASIYGFNTSTNQSIGLVARGPVPSNGGSGDWAFDRDGRLYVVGGQDGSASLLSVVNQAVPTTSQSTPLAITATQIASIAANDALNGMAFGGDGYLYVSTANRVYKRHPSTGAAAGQADLSPGGVSVDLASCASPNTIELVKDFPDGRKVATDQVDLTISGDGLSTGNTGTTAGTDSGVQNQAAETAGPVLGLGGQTYTITETGAGSGAAYTKSWRCINSATNAEIASGSGTTGSFVMPSSGGISVLCTFTNAPLGEVDFGDAAASYGTTSADNGARHNVVGYNATAQTAPLMLGTRVDIENDGAPGANATGDDSVGVDDEDGVVFNTDVSVPGRLETVFVTSSAAGVLNGWIDFDRDGAFEASERVFDERAVTSGVNRLTYTVPTGAAFDGGDTAARFRLTQTTGQAGSPTGAAPNGEVEDYRRTLFDARQEALERCPVGSTPVPVGIIQNPSFEDETQTFTNSSANTINFARHWYDSHPSGGQYYHFEPAPGFDSGPAEATMPFRAGADGSGFLGGHTSGPGDSGEGASNTLAQPMVPGAAYVGFFSLGAGGHSRNGSGYMTMFGVNDRTVGSIPTTGVTPHSATNSEELFDTPVVAPAAAGSRPQWKLSTFALRPDEAWTYLRVEARNANPANNGSVGGQAWISFDDFHLYLCDPIRDYGDAPASYGTELGNGAVWHDNAQYDETDHTAPLMLGDTIDVEDDGTAGVAADGDDTTDADDEDGVGHPIVVTAGQQATVTVSATNESGSTATLGGWIDLDRDGTFETGERQTVAVPTGSVDAGFTLTFPGPTVGGDSYARFRIFPGTPADPQPTGPADGGEVEDYPTTFQAGDPIFDTCSNLITFDNGNEGWRAATTSFGTQVNLGPVPVEWQANAGNPGGAVIEDDLDGTWTELWTPALVANGYTTDYTDQIGETVQFDYRNNTGISVRVYMGVVGANGAHYWFNFRPQITNSKAWNRIRVPLDASQWVTGFSNGGGGPTGTAPTAAQFEAALANVNRFTFSIEGQTGPDRTAFDNFGLMCSDFGDAPNSYGTEIGGESASHTVDVGNDPLRLGAEVDVEDAGQPGAGANRDDATATDDEDGVGDEIVMTVGEPTMVEVAATNNTGAPATLVGWLDLDGDGTFEVAERVTIPVGGGTATYPVVFPPGPESTTTAYARFRLFPGTVTNASPTGAATAGEVEDYPVTVLNRALEIEKTSDATAESRPGDAVTYTVTMTNTGEGDYTDANPARLVDDLTAVLDDADYNADAVATVDGATVTAPTYNQPRLRWEGPLAGGESVVIEYTVTLTGGGDGTVRNTAWVPQNATPGPTPDCDDPATAVPCAEEEYLLPKLEVRKQASRTDLPADGGQITYTVTVRNVGPGAYTAAAPAAFSDDLSDVEDDADFLPGSITATSGTPSYAEPELTWSGPLAAGAQATVTYTFVYDEEAGGDHFLINNACVSEDDAADPGDRCGSTTTPGSGLDQAKSATPASGTSVEAGDEITYRLRFTNAGQTPAIVDTTDDLTDVVDDATLLAGSITYGDGLTAVPNGAGDALEIDGTVPVGETRYVTYTVRVNGFADQGNHVLRNALACQPGDPADCVADTTEHPIRALAIDKSSDASSGSRPGDVVTYTITAENVGEGDYTEGDPAVVLDDLSDLLDDALWRNDAVATVGGTAVAEPSFDRPLLSWVGALGAGETVVITYSVQLEPGGDGRVRNAAFVAPCDPADAGCDPVTPVCDNGVDPDTGLACVVVENLLPRMSITKTVDPVAVDAVGDVLTYTVVVKNEGPGDYTGGDPATFSDDLSQVLDDATYVAGSETADRGTASYAEPELSWSGVLLSGEDATVTYQVRYTGAGDTSLVNEACVPENEATDPAENCATVTVPGSRLSHAKSVDPASGTPVEDGQVLTYTLTFANTGDAAATVDTTDDLSDVLDDAEPVTGSITAGTGLDAQLDGESLDITGTVPAGATRTVTYQVRVLPFADQGDHDLRNALACEPGEPTPCDPEVTTNPVRHLRVTKTSTPTAVDTGDEVTYVVEVSNDGAGDYTADDPASVVDDLGDVIDDALFDVDDVEVTDGSAAYDSPELTWSGPLPAGESVTITYTVVVTNLGDHDLVNTVSGVRCATGDTACAPPPTVTPLPHVVPDKTADPVSGTALAAGDLVSYTLSWTNDGTADGVVDATDDLSDVLDDAELVAGPTASSAAVDATIAGDELRVVGPISVGGDVTVTYQVRVRADGDRGDDRMANVLTADTPQVDCVDGDCEPVDPPRTSHLIGALYDWKTSDPPGRRMVLTGDRITYTLHFTNTGAAPVEVHRDDVLHGVLDDAVLVSAPRASDPALAASRVVSGRFTVTGVLAPDQTATVSYTVRVKPRARQGDRSLGNFLVDAGQRPPRSCQVAASQAAPGRRDCTVHQVRRYDLTVSKRAMTKRTVGVGDTVEYRIVVGNKGPDAATGRVKVVDRLPRGLDLRSVRGEGWSCSMRDDTNTATCVLTRALAPGRSAPRIEVVATVRPSAAGDRVVNTARVKGVGDANVRNNDDPAVLSVAEIPPLPGTGYRQVLPPGRPG